MKFKKLLIPTAVALFAMSACKKGGSTPPQNTTPKTTVDIYVAGRIAGSGGVEVAAYWKNGTQVIVGDGIHTSGLSGIAVNTTGVYAIGTSVNVTHGQYVGALWSNGIETQLTAGMISSGVNSIALSGSDVYIAGFFRTNPTNTYKTVAAIWKNGVMTALADTISNSEAYSVVVSAGHVYVGGLSTNAAGQFEATYWKDNIPTVVSSDPVSSIAYCMAVNGSDVYLGGSLANNQSPVYWKNGVVGSISGGPSSILYAMAVTGSDIYFAGSTTAQAGGVTTGSVATVWKNGVLTTLTDASSPSYATGIAINGTDVYITGIIDELASGNNPQATYWKNGVAVNLSQNLSTANAIAVVPK